MAYGEKYRFCVDSQNGSEIKILIRQDGYTGQLYDRPIGRSPLLRRENNGKILGSSFELYAECLVDGEYAELYTSSAREFKVEVYKNETVIWFGFITPELYSEPDIAPPYDVQIVATDGLGELKNYEFLQHGLNTLYSHLSNLLRYTGLDLDFLIASTLQYLDVEGAESGQNGLLNYMIDLSHLEGESCYDVLQVILDSLNAKIMMYDGQWLIYRETDLIYLASGTGLRVYDADGLYKTLDVASFGSMLSCQWWPVGQLSSVVVPAKNRLSIEAPNHYKSNILDDGAWSVENNASYDSNEGAYILPDEGSNIVQKIEFGREFGSSLRLSILARNVGSGDEDQPIGIEVLIDGRSYAGARQYWLVQTADSDRGIGAYVWKTTEGQIEGDLAVPSESDSSDDAQEIEIVLPLYNKNIRSYFYASSVQVRLFNPAGTHDIYVYDCRLSLYSQQIGWKTDALIDNQAREDAGTTEVTMIDSSTALSTADIVMTGVPLDPQGKIIQNWKIGDNPEGSYLAVLTEDYAMAVALPRMKYVGTLNVPADNIPVLFLRDARFYSLTSYSYDMLNDEVEVELLSIPVADVDVSQEILPMTSATNTTASGSPGGSGGGIGSGGGSSIWDLFYWIEEGKTLGTKYNLVAEGDVASKEDGEDTPSTGAGTVTRIIINGVHYDPDTQGVIDLSEAFEGFGADVDLSDYYTKSEVDAKLSNIDLSGYYTKDEIDAKQYITAADLSPYAKLSDLDSYLLKEGGTIEGDLRLKGSGNYGNHLYFGDGSYCYLHEDTDDHLRIFASKGIELSSGAGYPVTINGESIATVSSLDDYTKQTDFNALKQSHEALESALNDDVSGTINTWNEIVDFLNEYSGSEDLETILVRMEANTNSRLLASTFNSFLSGDFAQLEADVREMRDQDDELAGDIASNLSAIKTLQGYFTNGVANRAIADANGNTIGTYYTPIATYNAFVTAYNQKVQSYDKMFGDLQDKDEELMSDIEGLQTLTRTHDTQISGLLPRMDNAETRISNNSDAVQEAVGLVTTLRTEYDLFEQSVEDRIRDMQDVDGELNESMSALKTRKITAGLGLTGGGTLNEDVVLNIDSANDGIKVNADNILLNVVTDLTTDSATRALAASQGVVLNARLSSVEGSYTTLNNKVTNLGNHIDALYTWKDELESGWMKYVSWDPVNSAIKISAGLVVDEDASSNGDGEDTPPNGTVISVMVDNVIYDDVTEGVLNLTTLFSKYTTSATHTALVTRVKALEDKATAVSYTPTLTSGKTIGSLTIDGKRSVLYAPASYSWSEVTGKPSFATVATSGSYADLSNKPTLATFMGSSAIGSTTAYPYWTGSAWATKTLPTKLSDFTDDVVAGKYLSLATGGTVKGNIYSTGNLSADGSGYYGGNLSTDGYLSFGEVGANLRTTDPTTSFRLTIFGNTTSNSRLRTFRANANVGQFSSAYASGLAWATADTHGYMAISPYASVKSIHVGGGDAGVIDWSAQLFHNQLNIIPGTSASYNIGSSSYKWKNLFLSGAADVNSLVIGSVASSEYADGILKIDGSIIVTGDVSTLD